MYYFGARYYDPETGRFITKDPDGGDLDNPLSQNPYIYANDNPVNLVDPDGEFVFVPAVAAEIAIAVGLTIAIEAKYHPIQKGILALDQGITAAKNWYLSKKKKAKEGAEGKELIRKGEEILGRRHSRERGKQWNRWWRGLSKQQRKEYNRRKGPKPQKRN